MPDSPEALATQAASPPATLAAFHARLEGLHGKLPGRLQQCADHLARHPDSIALSTVAEVARAAGVPPSALMRFCQQLGFTGYAEMQRLFRRALMTTQPDYATRLETLKAQGAGQPAALVAEFAEAGRLSLERLARNLDETILEQAISTLSPARTIHLAGFGRSFSVASYLAYVCDRLGLPVVLHDGVGRLAQAASLQPGDALLAITFAPCSDETLALAAQARARGIPAVFLTDPAATPPVGPTDIMLRVTEMDFGDFRSLSATIALALALAVAVASRRNG